MIAFGQEECGDYASAEKTGKEALGMNRQDAWATHALAHVYEMTGQYDQGIRYHPPPPFPTRHPELERRRRVPGARFQGGKPKAVSETTKRPEEIDS